MLNIYAQAFEHDYAEIVGELEDLIKLKNSIDNIINLNRKIGSVEEIFASDGEGYRICIEVKTEEEMLKIQPHYRYEDCE